MIYLAVGRGPSPLFGTAKLGIKKSIPLQCNRMPMICQRFANVLPKNLSFYVYLHQFCTKSIYYIPHLHEHRFIIPAVSHFIQESGIFIHKGQRGKRSDVIIFTFKLQVVRQRQRSVRNSFNGQSHVAISTPAFTLSLVMRAFR